MEYLEPAVMIVLGLMILIAAAAWGVVLLVLRRTALRDWAAIEIWLTVTIFVGYNFFGPDVITAYFNGTALDYPLIESANVLSATVPAALVAEPGDYDCWLDGNDAPYGVTNHVIFTVITADGLPPILPGDPCNIIDETRKASDGSCVKCVANVWTATAAGDCEPSAGGDLGDLYVYGLETHE